MSNLSSILSVALIVLASSPDTSAAEKKWKVFEGCTLVDYAYNDADSFHVKYNNRSYIFRLYYVDAPETDSRYPERLAEQATDMGIAADEVVKRGKEATRFTEKFLKEPFTVYTTYENARGASDKKRYYAMVETEAGFLSQALMENGLARLKGYQPDPPGPLSTRTYATRLRALAKKAKSGTLAAKPNPTRPAPVTSSAALDGLTGTTVTAQKSILIFNEKPPHAPAGTVKPGTELTVLEPAPAGRMKVTFTFPSGRSYTGFCLKADLMYRAP